MMTAAAVAGMTGDLEQQYQTLMDRVAGYPMPEAARARILAEIEAAYRRSSARDGRLKTCENEGGPVGGSRPASLLSH